MIGLLFGAALIFIGALMLRRQRPRQLTMSGQWKRQFLHGHEREQKKASRTL